MEKKLGGTVAIQNEKSEFFFEYYLTKDREENYGLKIDKKERKSGELILCEEYVSKYTTDDVLKANNILNLLVKNKVTPITVDNILHDLGYLSIE